jgi:hypothetical protein
MHRRPRAAGVLAAIGLATLVQGARARADETVPGASGLRWRVEAHVEARSWAGAQDLALSIGAENPTQAPVTIESGDLLLAGPGGWLTPLDVSGTLFAPEGAHTVPPDGMPLRPYGPFHQVVAPATHFLLLARGGEALDAIGVPIRPLGASNGAAPEWSPPDGFGVGVAGPLQAVRFSDGNRSVILLGQHQHVAGARPEDVRTGVLVSDGRESIDVEWTGLGEMPDLERLWPFVRRIDLPASFTSNVVLRLHAEANVDGSRAEFRGEWPVTLVEPVPLLGPVQGSWQLGNGPGEAHLHAHYREPEQRWAYDLVVMENGRTYVGDIHRNESYFAWNRDVLAAADGRVVECCDRETDNPGLASSPSPCASRTNRIVIQHADGLMTVYLHLKRDSARVLPNDEVKAGQVIAKVGNSGRSTEPHLQFLALRFDAAGRPEPVPVQFRNAFLQACGEERAHGVPVGGRIYCFR